MGVFVFPNFPNISKGGEAFLHIPIILISINYADEYEGNFDQRKLTTIDCTFTVQAYIFGPTQTG